MTDSEFRDGKWRIAVPLPLYSVLHVQCGCGRRFWLRSRAVRYEAHYRAIHIAGDH